MSPLIDQHRQAIDALCRQYAVKRLELFGSAARDDFDPANSDADFFVEFLDYSSPTIADQWFGIQEDLERPLGRKVDLVSPRATTNPYFLESAGRKRTTLYAG